MLAENLESIKKFADANDSSAAFSLAMIYKDGRSDVRANIAQYAHYIKKAADGTLTDVESKQTQCAKNIALASLLVARSYKYGNDGFVRDEATSMKYYIRAADGVNGLGSGHILACRVVGTCYTDGKSSLNKDSERALHYFTMAADGGDGPSMLFVAKNLLTNKLSDEDKAGFYLKKYLFRERLEKEIFNYADYGKTEGSAANMYTGMILHNEPRKCIDFLNQLPTNFGAPQTKDELLGWYYVQLGLYDTALPYLRRGLKTANARCARSLGYMYAHGYGVDQDFTQAKYYLEIGADCGDVTCKEALQTMPEMIASLRVKTKRKSLAEKVRERKFRK